MTGKLLLRHDLYRSEAEEGMVLLAHHGEVVVHGRSAHRWVNRLAPYLDGTLSLDEITAALSAPRKAFVESLLTALLEHDVVCECGDDQNGAPGSGRVRDTGAARETESPARESVPDQGTAPTRSSAEDPPEVSFLGYFQNAPARGFARYRESAVLVLGSSELFPFVVRALLSSGCRHVRTVDDAAGQPVEHYEPATDDERRELITSSDAVVRVADRASADPELDELCSDSAIPLVQASVAEGEVWLSPVATDGPAWSNNLRRLTGLAPAGRSADVTTATVVANQLVQRLFLAMTGVREHAPVSRIDANSLITRHHAALPHPYGVSAAAETHEAFAQKVAELEQRSRLDAETFFRAASAAMDGRAGAFGPIREGALTQLPLRMARTTVADPVGLLPAGQSLPVVTGAGLNATEARRDAALAALARYGSLMLDPRRLVTDRGEQLVARDNSPEQALDEVRANPAAGHVRAVDLVDHRARLIPVTMAFPALLGDPRAPVGLAAAYCWSEALEAGLFAHCEHRAIAQAQSAGQEYPLLKPQQHCDNETTEHFLRLLTTVDHSAAFYDMTGELGAPTVACCLEGRTVAVASASTLSAALYRGARRALLAFQTRWELGSDGPDEITAPPTDLRDAPETVRDDSITAHSSRNTADLVAALRRDGYRPVAVPLDHDREIHRIMPNLVRVVVCHDND